jgi:hypothetical protein
MAARRLRRLVAAFITIIVAGGRNHHLPLSIQF